MNAFKILIALLLISTAAGYGGYKLQQLAQTGQQEEHQPEAGMEAEMARMEAAFQARKAPSYEGSSAAGSYLSGRFAQRHHDWKKAGRYIDYVLKKTPDDPALLKRAMVLALGAGDYQRAFNLAHEVIDKHEADNALSQMFLTAQAFKQKDYKAAADHISAMPEGGLSAFIMPLLYSWASAALGDYDVSALKGNSIHLYHAVLISDYLGKTTETRQLLKQALASGELDVLDLERIADLYAHIGEMENAVTLYEQAIVIDPENSSLHEKLEAAKSGNTSYAYLQVRTPEQGIAEAFFDMARLLSQDFSDESARVFARLSVYLDPQMTQATFLLAQIAARNGRYDEAIALYNSITPESDHYLQAQRNAADILQDEGRSEEAIAALKNLFKTHHDLEALIQIGNIERMNENYEGAIKAYDKAFEEIGGTSKDYWHLHYVRGMSYEQAGQWDKAEKDLLQALKYQPDHPYILNYLGYAWADKGEKLEDALLMIEHAAELRPGDGYITDSLGWVYYRMGRYDEAVPYLEQAVELMPYDPTINDHLGDAYWTVGRHMEAEFQWKRAKNHSEDAELIAKIDKKLKDGLETNDDIKAASPPAPAVDLNKTAQESSSTNSEVQ